MKIHVRKEKVQKLSNSIGKRQQFNDMDGLTYIKKTKQKEAETTTW